MRGYLLTTFIVLHCCVNEIYGGRSSRDGWNRADKGYNPWIVWFEKSTDYACGGVLIDEQWAVTGAQCASKGLDNAWINDYHTREKDGEQRRPVQRIVVHPSWDGKLSNDIALVQLRRPSTVPPIRTLANSLMDKLADQPENPCYIIGWGKRKLQRGEKYVWRNSAVLQYLAVSVPSNVQCRIEMKDIEIDNPICSFSKLEGPCQDDIGNPMVCLRGKNPVLVGIQSVGSPGCTGGYNGMTRISKYRGWMRNIIARVDRTNIPMGRQCVPGGKESPCRDKGAQCSPSKNGKVYKCLCDADHVKREGRCVDLNQVRERQPMGAPCSTEFHRPCAGRNVLCFNGVCRCKDGYAVNGNACEPKQINFDTLRVRFDTDPALGFKYLPRTKPEAMAAGWTVFGDPIGCDAHPNFLGERMWKDSDASIILIYDPAGYIAGIQAGVPENFPNNTFNYPFEELFDRPYPPFVKGQGYYFVTAYFVNPETLCDGRTADQFAVEGTGTGVWLQMGLNAVSRSTFPIAHQSTDAEKTWWQRAGCYPRMGRHYAYRMTDSMSCENIFPVFLLYNEGVLTGFGWGFIANLPSPNYEPVPPQAYALYPPRVQECLRHFNILVQFHIYLTESPLNITCPEYDVYQQY